MRINEVKKNEANITLDADELISLGNVLYFYEQHYDTKQGDGKPAAKFHELAAQIITARDLCQYGRLDNHSLSCIVRHKSAANPDSGLTQQIMDMTQFYPKNFSNAQKRGENDGK